MNVNIEENSALRRKLTIEVEPDEIKRELDKTYNELRRGVVLKGFRPGHAPRNLLEKFFGDQVRSEVIQKLVKEYTDKALEEHNLKPIVEPEIINEETNLPATLKFSAVFDLKPEVVLKDYQGLKVPEETIAITDKDVDDTIERLRERQASLKKVEGRDVVEEGDVAVVTIEGFEDGKPLSEAKSENRLLEDLEEEPRARHRRGADRRQGGGGKSQSPNLSARTTSRRSSRAKPSNGARTSRKSTRRNCRRWMTTSPRIRAISKAWRSCATGCARTSLPMRNPKPIHARAPDSSTLCSIATRLTSPNRW